MSNQLTRAQRALTKEKAAVEVYGRDTELSIANVLNLSKTGACLQWVEGTKNLSKGDLIRLTVTLNSINRKHKMSAEVVWSDGQKSGIQFLNQEQLLTKMLTREF